MSEKLPTHSAMAVSSEPTSRSSTLSFPLEKAQVPVSHDIESVQKIQAEWKPHKQEYLVMFTLAIISLMVALDATILVTVLPVTSIASSYCHSD